MKRKSQQFGILVLSIVVLLGTLTACITPGQTQQTYTVTFKDHDGAVLSTETVVSGHAAKAPAEPTREGYVFTGWDKSFDHVTSDLTVTAQYQAESTAPRFVASSVKAKAGDTVRVTVSMKHNPGVSSIILSVAFDEEALTLEGVSYNNAMGGKTVQPETRTSPVKLYWINALANTEGDMTFATLTFRVKDGATPGDHAVSLSYNADDVYNLSETNLPFENINGTVTVTQ
ncbi:MAG: InlB B-repeat-containing protein [Clostridia bacterium]|nr:InlB B-repeat-containing protein [Clostridia bacterium]